MARYSKNDRVNRIIEMVSKDDNVTISYLADYFSVSHMTIRRDVEELQNSPEYSNKSRENTDYKKAVVLKAYKLLRPQQTVFMDGGTTVKQLSGLIDMPLTVLTNDISTAGLLNENELIRVILCPGEIARESLSAYSSETLRFLSEHYFDIAFIGADGFSKENGAMTTSQVKADCKWMAANRAIQSVLLVDHSKKNVFCKYKIADLEFFSEVITDDD